MPRLSEFSIYSLPSTLRRTKFDRRKLTMVSPSEPMPLLDHVTIPFEGLVLERRTSVVSLVALSVTRSEEHTSELQSLMRISYAVFCLKKKTLNTRQR